MTLVLLVGSGLLLRTIGQLGRVAPGFDPRHVLSFKVGISPSLTQTPAQTRIALRQLLDRIRQIPGIEAADVSNIIPLSGDDNSGPFWLGTAAPASMQEAPHALYFWTGPEYLRTMKIPLLRGRFFSLSDGLSSEPVVAIDSVLARTYFPGKDPIEKPESLPGCALGSGAGGWRGGPCKALGTGRYRYIQPISDLHPCRTATGSYRASAVQLSLHSGAHATGYRNRDAAHSQALCTAPAKDQPVYNIKTLQEVVSASMSAQRLPMLLLAAFAGLASCCWLQSASMGCFRTQ